MTTEYHTLPQPETISKYEKEDAMGSYLMMFAALGAGLPLPFINILAAIIYHFINAKKSYFVKFHSLQSMLSQILVGFFNAVLVSWAVCLHFFEFKYLIGTDSMFWGFFWMVLILNLIYFILSVIAALKAKKGLFFYLPLFGSLAYHYAYKKKPEKEHKDQLNQPPFS